MTLDINKSNPTIALSKLETPIVAYSYDISVEKEKYTESYIEEFPFRYTVHRQHKGFFTPMVYDVLFEISYLPGYAPGVKFNFEEMIEPFVEGALFVDDESPILPLMLKGSEHGINRKELVEEIKSTTKYEFCGIIDPNTVFNDKGIPWYSDWIVPPPTIQGNRIYVYDMDNECHGSRLDPIATIKHLVEEWQRRTASVSALKQGNLPVSYIVNVELTAGYTQPVTVHKD